MERPRHERAIPRNMIICTKINKFILSAGAIAFLCVCVNAGILDQKPSGAINDFAGILSKETQNTLEAVSKSLFVKTGVALVLVTTASLDGENIDEAANALFTKWGIGAKGKDEGILLVVATQDRALRIETGYGAEGYLTDAAANRIIRNIAAPLLSKGLWDDGLSAAFIACASLAAQAHNTSLEEITNNQAHNGGVPAGRPYKPNPFSIIIILALIAMLAGTRGGRSILYFMLISSLFSGSRGAGYRSSGFGGGFGGSGGFGGFGGGMSGGGGASGRF